MEVSSLDIGKTLAVKMRITLLYLQKRERDGKTMGYRLRSRSQEQQNGDTAG